MALMGGFSTSNLRQTEAQISDCIVECTIATQYTPSSLFISPYPIFLLLRGTSNYILRDESVRLNVERYQTF